MRAIVRFSVSDDRNDDLHRKLAHVLVDGGFALDPSTAAHAAPHIEGEALAVVLVRFWERVRRHDGRGQLAGFWIRADRTPLDDMRPAARHRAPPAERRWSN